MNWVIDWLTTISISILVILWNTLQQNPGRAAGESGSCSHVWHAWSSLQYHWVPDTTEVVKVNWRIHIMFASITDGLRVMSATSCYRIILFADFCMHVGGMGINSCTLRPCKAQVRISDVQIRGHQFQLWQSRDCQPCLNSASIATELDTSKKFAQRMHHWEDCRFDFSDAAQFISVWA